MADQDDPTKAMLAATSELARHEYRIKIAKRWMGFVVETLLGLGLALGAGTLAELDAYWKRQAEDALKLGRQMKRDSEDLVFPSSIFEPRRPRHPRGVTKEFIAKARKLGFAGLRFHDLRHTHATLLLKNGENLKVVSERLGHANATITLNVYQYVLPGMQEKAAAMIDRILDGTAAALT